MKLKQETVITLEKKTLLQLVNSAFESSDRLHVKGCFILLGKMKESYWFSFFNEKIFALFV